MNTLPISLQETAPNRTSSFLKRLGVLVVTALAALIAIAPAEAALVTASITKNNVTFSASGLEFSKSYLVVIKDLNTASSTQQTVTSTAVGYISPSSGTTGAPISAGSTVQVSIIDPESGATVGSTSVNKPKPKNKLIDALLRIIRILV